jgi:hypothetical protein
MNKKQIIILVIIFAVATVIMRLVPHPWNFTPMGALVLFSGFMLPKKWIWLPLVALVISDIIIGSYTFGVMATVYSSYALMLGISYAARHHYSFGTAIGSSVASAVIFFILTNAAVWAFSGIYSPDASGLMASYSAAIPFFRNSFAGYLVYSALFFGVYEFALAHEKKLTYSRVQL